MTREFTIYYKQIEAFPQEVATLLNPPSLLLPSSLIILSPTRQSPKYLLYF